MRKHRQGEEVPRYLVLFQAMDQLEEYDEEELRHLLEGEKMLKQLGTAKDYLLRLLLSDLRAFAFEKDPFQQLRGLLDELELIAPRKLFALARRLIKKGLRKSRELGAAELELEFLQWQRRMNREEVTPATGLEEREAELLRDIQRKVRIMAIHDPLYFLSRKEKVIRDEALNHKLNGLAQELDQLGKPLTSFDGQLAWHTTWTLLLVLKGGSIHEIFAHMVAKHEVWQSYPKRIQLHQLRYVRSLFNLYHFAHKTDQGEEFKPLITRFMEDQRNPPWSKDWIQLRILHIQLLQFLDAYQYPEALALIPQMEEAMENEGKGDINMFRFNIIFTYFLANDYSAAQIRLNKMLMRSTSWSSDREKGTALLLEPMLFYARKDYESIPYQIRAAERFLKKTGQIPDWVNSLFKFLRRAVRFPEPQKRKEAEKALLVTLQDSEEKAMEDIREYFQRWLEAELDQPYSQSK